MYDGTRTQPPDLPEVTPSNKTESAPPPASNSIPGYDIFEMLGEGGMGVVYRATQLKLNRTVAVKMLLGRAGAREIIRFLAEAQAVGSIDHPNVVKVFESGDGNGNPYLAMEYLPGGSLADLLKKSPPAPREAATLVRKLALGMQAAHDLQIIHRDLKPANVLFDAAGEPKITDFGLAKRMGVSDITSTNAVMGTAAYMAPEQAKGENKFVGPAADVWALGVILYECLAGVRPFTGSTHLEVVRKVVEAEPESLRSHSGKSPRDLELVARKCLAKDPAGRYGSAAALAEELRRWLDGEPVSVKAAGPVERILKWTKRNKIATGIVAGLSLAVAVTTATAFVAFAATKRAEAEARRADRENEAAKDSARRADLEADSAKKEAIRADQNAKAADENATMLAAQFREQRMLLDAMRVREAGYAIDQNNIRLARELLKEAEPRHWLSPDNRTGAWWIVKREAEGGDRILSKTYGRFYGVAWSPNGRMIASGSDNNALLIWDAATGTCREINGHAKNVHSVSWSPDSRMIASASDDTTVRLWDATTGESLRELSGHAGPVKSVAWSPDGRTVASASGDKTVRLWDAATGTNIRELKHAMTVNGVSWNPDGRMIVSAGEDKIVRIWDVPTGMSLRELKGHTRTVHGVSWSPDGRMIVSASEDKTVRLWNAATGENLRELNGHTGSVRSLTWSPDGRKVASASMDYTVRLWDAATGTSLRELKGHTGNVMGVSWSPDGRTIASGDTTFDATVRLWDATTGDDFKGRDWFSVLSMSWSPDGRAFVSGGDKILRIWDTVTGGKLREFKGHTRAVQSVSWSPDGRTIASAGDDTTVRLWDSTTGESLRELKGHTMAVKGVSWSPDSRMVASASDDKTVRLWDATTGESLRELKGHPKTVNNVSWSPDSRMIASASDDKTVRLWDAATGACLRELSGHTGLVKSVTWSPDSRMIASGGQDTTVRLWDAATGAVIRELKGHTWAVWCLSWSPDGRTIASGSGDKTVRLWDTATGVGVREFKIHNDSVHGVSWTQDGRTLACSGLDKTVQIWNYWRDPSHPEEIARFKRMIDPNPFWHRQQAVVCEKQSNFFAALFHLRKLAALEPNDTGVKTRLAAVEKRLSSETAPKPPASAP
ncbi:WD40 domain-containing protein [Zavarzinella formosa]|uniref:WD40 domain-containing protein n=1 Tax=Zavarzinella formosa TaxID=360055 RepID=UPI00036F5552|nr:protein kinase [Zavarzinella formosa]